MLPGFVATDADGVYTNPPREGFLREPQGNSAGTHGPGEFVVVPEGHPGEEKAVEEDRWL